MNRSRKSRGHRGHPEESNIRSTPLIKAGSRRATWRFTWNNYEEKDPEELEEIFLKMNAKKFIFQEEIGKKNKTPHLQGCVFFKSDISFNTMKAINKRIAWYKLDYPKSAIKYCCKSDTKKEGGGIWYYGIALGDYVEKPKKPLMGHKEMLEYMCKCFIDDLLVERDKMEYDNLWETPNHGFGMV